MSEHHKFKIDRVAYPEDPNRCQATIKSQGQCLLRSVPDSKFCPCHGGNKAAEAQNKKNVFSYRLAKYQQRLDELTENDSIKSLRDEIAIVRFLVQKRMDFCEDQSTLLLHSAPLGRLILQIRSLSVTCQKVEEALGNIIDHESAFTMAYTLLKATHLYCKNDNETITAVSESATELLQRLYSKNTGKHASNYKIVRWAGDLNEFLTEERVTTLRNEIGVLRLIVEELLESCHDEHALIFKSQLIIAHISQIEDLVKSCHRLENSSGLLLSEADAMQFAQELITAIGNVVTDSDKLEQIATYFDREMTNDA